MRKRDLVDFIIGSPQDERHDSGPPDLGSAAYRLAFAIAGMVAFFVAMYIFGWL